MNRRGFFQALAFTAVAAIYSPSLLKGTTVKRRFVRPSEVVVYYEIETSVRWEGAFRDGKWEWFVESP